MITATKTLYLYVETPLHAGVGSGLSSVDLPIQRERTTQYPMIQGSGIKGKLRSIAEDREERGIGTLTREKIALMFGPRDNGADHAGALIAGDAHLLLFPVRSLNGVFAYTTSRDVLERFKRERERGEQKLPWEVPASVSESSIALTTSASQVSVNGTIVLEEFSFQAQKSEAIDNIADWIAEHALPDTYDYWRARLKQSLVILPDNDFRDFALYATEIITRIRIDRKTKTVENGALWTEEHLPADTLLYVPIYATDARKARKEGENLVSGAEILQGAASLEQHQGGYIQLGGDETVGRGLVLLHWEDK